MPDAQIYIESLARTHLQKSGLYGVTESSNLFVFSRCNNDNIFQRKIKQNQKLPTHGRPRRASQN